jgi:hypothetical protein
MFVGRVSELDKLESHLLQTRARQPVNFLLTGERGIGKTSLLDYIKNVARGRIPVGEEKLSFLVVETDIDPKTTQMALVKKIELGLRRELGKSEKARTFLSEAWGFIQRVEAAGVALKDKKPSDAELLVEEFAYSLADTVNRVTKPSEDELFATKYEGLLLLIDEADNASAELSLGSFLKLLTERLQRNDCDSVMVGLAGLPEVHRILITSHPSSLRIFEEVPLGRLSDGEVKTVIDFGIKRANENNADQVTITEDAKEALVSFSEGFPHFIQQFGYCAFAADTDGKITPDDVTNGAFGHRGGLEAIGDRYYRNDFYNKVQKDSYRQVLRIMARKADGWVAKTEIRKSFQGKDSTLDNAIQALRERHIILSREGHRGVYRLQHRGFALWINLYTSDQHAGESISQRSH